jgi:16S rRNA processing protein RimM
MKGVKHLNDQKEKEVEKVKIGKIFDAHGIKGEVSVFVFSGDLSWLSKLKTIYFQKKSGFEAHQVVKKRPHKQGFICLLENFTDRNKAEEYARHEVWVDADLFVSNEGESIYLNEILGFEVVDANLGSLGKVDSFSSNGVQDLIMIERVDQKPIEIPFIKEFVTKLDFKEKKIKMNLPEGLIEINEEE